MLYLSDNLAYIPYSVLDEPLYVIHHIDIQISVSGTNLLQSFKEASLSPFYDNLWHFITLSLKLASNASINCLKIGENEFIVSFEMVILSLKCENPLKIRSNRRFSATDFEFGVWCGLKSGFFNFRPKQSLFWKTASVQF